MPLRTFYPLAASVFTCLFAICGCGGGSRTDENGADIARWVVSKGGEVVLAGSDRTLTRVDELPEGAVGIRSIDLAGRRVGDADLERLATLENLHTLVLHQTAVSDAGLDQLASLKGLRRLELSYTPVTDEGIAKLRTLKRLQRLFVRGTGVSEDGAAALEKEIPGLKVVRP